MTFIARTLRAVSGFALLATLLAACGGGDSSAVAGSGSPAGNGHGDTTPPPPAVIEGIATPSSVSVVTATNAN